MASSGAAGTSEDLKRYMKLLADVRRSSIILCDSIRLSEFDGGQITQDDQITTAEDAPRCPICTFEYHDPTVTLSGCGHGMHEACAHDFIGNAETGADDNDARLFSCSMCRLPFRKENIVL